MRPLDYSISRPLEGASLRVLGMGLGVQSTTLALMHKHGEFGEVPISCAITADTKAETLAIYEHLRFLRSPNVGLPYPIVSVSNGHLGQDVEASAQSWQAFTAEEREDCSLWKQALRVANPPFFTRGPRLAPKHVEIKPMPLFPNMQDEVDVIEQAVVGEESFGILGRKCTRDYKINPVVDHIRTLLGLAPGENGPSSPVVEQWIGISLDEIERLSMATVAFIQHRWPLIEARMSRSDCVEWLLRHGYPIPPKSRCFFCPYQRDELWWEMKRDDAATFAEACAFDRAIRHGVRGTLHQLFLHALRIPLEDIDFEALAAKRAPGPMFALNECSGYCGT